MDNRRQTTRFGLGKVACQALLNATAYNLKKLLKHQRLVATGAVAMIAGGIGEVYWTDTSVCLFLTYFTKDRNNVRLSQQSISVQHGSTVF